MRALRDEVVAIITEICRPEKPDLTDEDRSLLECGLDSLDFASVLMALEDKYGVTIDERDMESLRSLRKIVGYLESRVGS